MNASRVRVRGHSVATATGPAATQATVSEVGTWRRRRSNGTATVATSAVAAAARRNGRSGCDPFAFIWRGKSAPRAGRV